MTDEKQIKTDKRVHVRASFKRNMLNKVLNGNVDDLVQLQKEIIEKIERVIIKLNNISI